MVLLEEINRAIVVQVKEALQMSGLSSIPLIAEDVSEPIIRPSVKVDIDKSSYGKFNGSCSERNMTCRVYFFASDIKKYKMENQRLRGVIENAFFDDLEVKKGIFITIDEVRSETVDKVLVCSFDLQLIGLIENENQGEGSTEMMDELEFKL